MKTNPLTTVKHAVGSVLFQDFEEWIPLLIRKFRMQMLRNFSQETEAYKMLVSTTGQRFKVYLKMHHEVL